MKSGDNRYKGTCDGLIAAGLTTSVLQQKYKKTGKVVRLRKIRIFKSNLFVCMVHEGYLLFLKPHRSIQPYLYSLHVQRTALP